MPNYPSSLMNYVHPGVLAFSTREQAETSYLKQTGKPLPPFDSRQPDQNWMDTRPKPSHDGSLEAGYTYNFVAQGEDWWFRMASYGVPYSEATVPNVRGPNDGPSPNNAMYSIPLRKLGPADDAPGSLEVIGSSPFGCEVTTTALLEFHGLLSVPPDVLTEIHAGKYVPPGVE